MRYVVKEEIDTPLTGNKNINDDLNSFTLAPFSAHGKDSNEDSITVIHEIDTEKYLVKSSRKVSRKNTSNKRNNKSKKPKKDASMRSLD